MLSAAETQLSFPAGLFMYRSLLSDSCYIKRAFSSLKITECTQKRRSEKILMRILSVKIKFTLAAVEMFESPMLSDL